MARGVAKKRVILTKTLLAMTQEIDEDDFDDLWYGGYFRFVKTLKLLLSAYVVKVDYDRTVNELEGNLNLLALKRQQLRSNTENLQKAYQNWLDACADPKLWEEFSERGAFAEIYEAPEIYFSASANVGRDYQLNALDAQQIIENNLNRCPGKEFLKEVIQQTNTFLKTASARYALSSTLAYAHYLKGNYASAKRINSLIAVTQNQIANGLRMERFLGMSSTLFLVQLLGESLKELFNEGETDVENF